MSEYGYLIQAKCDTFADRVVKLNDYLLDQAANKKAETKATTKAEGRGLKAERRLKFEG